MPAEAAEGKEREAVREAIRRLNSAWREDRSDVLRELYHPQAVVVQPGFGSRLQGRDACVSSYLEFAASATVHDYEESEHTVDIWGETAVATYRFRIDYELGGGRYEEVGRDLLVFVKEAGKWQVVWRTLTSESAGEL